MSDILTDEAIKFIEKHKKCALRVDNWKWVEGQLFDLSSDLSETRNLVGEQPRRAKAMSARLIELMK